MKSKTAPRCPECSDTLAGDEYLCPHCSCCSDCCECEDELFDADELGLDPEEDDRRKYGRDSDASLR